jgi:hypothetical protein
MSKKTAKRSGLLRRLRRHLGTDPAKLQVLRQDFGDYDRPNLHLAIEEILGALTKPHEVVGIVTRNDYDSIALAKLTRQTTARTYEAGPVEFADVALADGRQLACVKRGLYFLHSQKQPLALLVTIANFHMGGITVEAMAPDPSIAQEFLRRLTKETRFGRAFRGHILSIADDCHGRLAVTFHHLPAIRRDDIILPESLMQRIERHTLGFSRHAERLRAAGRHLKRGVLLHGPPGTGKTLSAMYLAAQMPGRTVLLMTGSSVRSLEAACRVARLLTPATIILEDVDLIGTERQHQTVGANALLFELLNQMDGLADDIDLLFVLTTNRPDILEPALAARPGRIDQAIEVPHPDADCRKRLLELYGRGLRLDGIDWAKLVNRTAGVSGAFIRELLRKAAVFAAEENGEGDGLVVQDRHLDEALGELLVAGGPITQSLLGVNRTGQRAEC